MSLNGDMQAAIEMWRTSVFYIGARKVKYIFIFILGKNEIENIVKREHSGKVYCSIVTKHLDVTRFVVSLTNMLCAG